MWCWRRMEKISWTDHVRNEEVLLRVNEQRNILHEIRKRRANWIGHILRRNCLLKQVIEGKIKGEMEVVRRRGRRRRKLLYDLKDRRGYSHLKEEALDRTIWRHRFGGGFGPVVRQNTEWMNVRLCQLVSTVHDSALRLLKEFQPLHPLGMGADNTTRYYKTFTHLLTVVCEHCSLTLTHEIRCLQTLYFTVYIRSRSSDKTCSLRVSSVTIPKLSCGV